MAGLTDWGCAMIVEHLRHSPLRRSGRHLPKRRTEECPELSEREKHFGAFEDGREIVNTFAAVAFSRPASSYKPRSGRDIPVELLTAAPRHETQPGSTGYQRKLVASKDDGKNTLSARELCRRGKR